MNPNHSPNATMLFFGGSFNPPHRAHFAIAHAAAAAFAPAQMYLVPSGQPWQKPHVAPAAHRLAMLELALQADQTQWYMSKDTPTDAAYPLRILRSEVLRDQPTYTVETLRQLRAEWPAVRLIWVIGSDQWHNFHTWREWREIMQLAHIAVAQRPGHLLDVGSLTNPEFAQYYQTHQTDAAQDTWQHTLSGWFIRFDAPSIELSSTQIRAQIAQHQSTPDIEPAVAQYIHAHHLYQSSDN